jgi:hypothetical protein
MILLLLIINYYYYYYYFVELSVDLESFLIKKLKMCASFSKKKIPFAKSKDLKGRKHLDCNYLNQLN